MSNHVIGSSLALITAMSWAAGVIFFKKSGESMSPFALNFFKNTVAVALFAVTFVVMNETLWEPDWGWDLFWLMFSGVIGIGISDVLFFRSLHIVGASRSAVIETLYSPSVLLSAFLLLGERMSAYTALGGGFILLGIGLVVTSKSSDVPEGKRLSRGELIDGVLTGVVSVIAMAISIVAVKPIIEAHTVLWATTMRLSGGLLIMIAALPFVPTFRRETRTALVPHAGWRYAIPGAFFGTYIALFSWIGGYKYTTATVASLLNQTSTLFIVAAATLFLGETLTRRRASAVALALGGSLIVLLTSGPESTPTANEPIAAVETVP
ncbi:MAG: DMT family transporter [Myxococcota bacterium]